MPIVATSVACREDRHPQFPDPVRAAVDRKLFAGPYFLLDADNRKLADIESMEAAHAAVSDGKAASYVAHVRPGTAAVDLDLDAEEDAEAVLHHLVLWCEDRSVWTHAEPSGGGSGRWHFLAVVGENLADPFRSFVGSLREWHGHSAKEIDLREAIRPLAAPHRKSPEVSRPPLPRTALAGLPQAAAARSAVTGQRALLKDSRTAVTDPAERLNTQQLAAFRMIPFHGDRSYTEFQITRKLKEMGASFSAVWNALTDSTERPELGHARQRGLAWFLRYFWDKIDAPKKPRDSYSKECIWNPVILGTSKAVRRNCGHLGKRQRNTAEHVAVVVAYHLSRKGLKAVPSSLRSLREDTGLDLKTIQKALDLLCRNNVLVKTEAYRYGGGHEVVSDVYALHQDVTEEAGALTTTPLLFTPSDPLWLGLPAGSINTVLTLMHTPTGTLTPSELAPSESPSSRQRSLLERTISALSERKILTRKGDRLSIQQAPKITRPKAGLSRWRAIREQVRLERAAFREVLAAARTAFEEQWQKQRAAAVEASRIANRRRQLKWWSELGADVRAARQAHYTQAYAELPRHLQEARLETIRSRRPSTALWELAA